MGYISLAGIKKPVTVKLINPGLSGIDIKMIT